MSIIGKNHPNLVQLHLVDTQVSDAGLKHLYILIHLDALYLTGTRVTAEGVKALRAALPRCTVIWEPPAGQAVGPAPQPAETSQSVEEGFVSLFDGKTLNGWQGATDRYSVQDGKIVADFGAQPFRGEGQLFSVREYGDFVLRLEYTMSPGANSGILLRAPLGDNAWQESVEVQILDDSAPASQRLPPQQLNGSLFNIVAVKPGHLRPIGQWNSLEVYWKARQVRVTLNGAVVVNTDLDDLSDKVGVGLQHPGLKRERGHIALMGYASQGKMEFRNIRIKDLSSPTDDGKARPGRSKRGHH